MLREVKMYPVSRGQDLSSRVRSRRTLQCQVVSRDKGQHVPYGMISKRALWGQAVHHESKMYLMKSKRTFRGQDLLYDVKTYSLRSRHALWGQDVPCDVKTCPRVEGVPCQANAYPVTLWSQYVSREVKAHPARSRRTLWSQDVYVK